jgi:flagellar L-ring protein precursor FlgH
VKRLTLALICAGPLLLSGPVRAESLWVRATPDGGYLFVDTRARKPGDLLTILIQENTGINNNDSRNMEKDTSAGGLFSLQGSTQGIYNSPSTGANLTANGSSTRKFAGSAQYQSSRVFTDQMTVTVIDVLPNSNLIIEGCRRVVVSGEERVLRVSGVVRPIDIGLGNIVESQFIGNFKAVYQGKGLESGYLGHGWFNKALHYVWPF